MKKFVCDVCGAECGSKFLRLYPRWIVGVMSMWIGKKADICQICLEKIRASSNPVAKPSTTYERF